jgi:hypothetical protein
MTDKANSNEHKNFSFELFILAISILAIVNIIIIILTNDPEMSEVLLIVNFALSLILIIDFGYRFFTAKSKVNYFLRQFGWLDLLGSFPNVLDANLPPAANCAYPAVLQAGRSFCPDAGFTPQTGFQYSGSSKLPGNHCDSDRQFPDDRRRITICGRYNYQAA